MTSDNGNLPSRRAVLAGGGALGLTLATAGVASARPSRRRTSAAETFGWGCPDWEDDFTRGEVDRSKWGLYDGPGHGGNGRRRPEQIRVVDGHLRITGTAGGDSGGMASAFSQKYGRWEARVRLTQIGAGHQPYHPVLLTWPDSEKWPDDGEYDFMETDMGARGIGAFMHYGDGTPAGGQFEYHTDVDITRWHCYAFEWTPQHLAGFVDGVQWFRCTDPKAQAPGVMHGTIQLDNFGGAIHNVGHMDVDWYRAWRL